MNFLPINNTRCLSTKNKNSFLQCPNKRKNECLFCGVHNRSKYPRRYDLLFNQKSKLTKNIKVIDSIEDSEEVKEIKHFYSVDELLNLSNLDNIKVKYLRNTIKNLNLTNKIKLNQSKRSLFTELLDYLNLLKKFENRISEIKKIQAFWRKTIVLNRSKCVNITDFLTLSLIFNISSKYYCEYHCDKDNLKYGYDLRSLSGLFESEKPKNPYTCKDFSHKFIKVVSNRLIKLNNNSIKTSFNNPVLSSEQKLNAYMLDIFQTFDQLDNYTNHRWFADLNLYQLKDLYKKAEDIWNYRTQLPLEVRKKIVNNGIAFTTPIHVVNKLVNKSKLQYLLLDEFKRFGSEGETRDDKKLGAMLILTALVEVSVEAAYAMPQYVQVY